MKKILVLLSVLLTPFARSQEHKSIHETQLEEYNNSGLVEASYYESIPNNQLVPQEKLNCDLEQIVYGWHPYWGGSAYQNYQWDKLSHFSFFSYEVNPATGNANSTHGWSTSAAVDAALASGNTKVTLCVTLFSDHTTFFGTPGAQQTLITNLINLVQSRGAHGVNIDFEGIPGAQSTNFANFMVNLSNQMHAAIPGSEVSTVLYAVDWNDVFDFSIMEPAVDHYIVMGYDYYYSGSSNAGPTDPLYHFGSTYNYTISRTITYYLDKGCPAEKLVMGLPSYGHEWATTSTSIPSSTTSSSTARTFANVLNNVSGNYSVGNHQWVADPQSDAFVFNDGVTKQCFISLDTAWRKRLEHIKKTGIAGIGIWALGYDNGHTEIWDAIGDYLTTCYEDPCSGSIHDFGGPTKNYYNNEDYTWTLAPDGASSIQVNFSMFDLEDDWDYLYLFDGPNDQSPQIAGSPFTGTNSPGQFTSSGGALTFRFYSDVSTVAPGFLATYQCNLQAAPVAEFALSELVICLGDSIQLQNNSTDADTYSWSVNSGGLSSATDEEPYLFPMSSGNYTISLEVTNSAGSDQLQQQFAIQVYEAPIAIGNATNNVVTLPNGIATFENNSLNATSYLWDFGDGNTSSDEEPWHQYSSGGSYSVLLIAGNEGCGNDTITIELEVQSLNINELYDNGLSIYPNPNNGVFTIAGTTAGNLLILTDIYGKVVWKGSAVEQMTEVDLLFLSAGIYHLNYGSEVYKILVE